MQFKDCKINQRVLTEDGKGTIIRIFNSGFISHRRALVELDKPVVNYTGRSEKQYIYFTRYLKCLS